MEHLGGAHGGAGIADQRMRHGAEAARRAEPVRGAVVGVADEALGALALGRRAADRGGVGHHVLHLGAGAVTRLHREEGNARQRQAHLIGVVRGDAGRADLLQQDCFQVRQMQRCCRSDRRSARRRRPSRLPVDQVDFELGAARSAPPLQPVQHQPRRGDHRAAQEDRIGDPPVAELLRRSAWCD